MKNKILTFSFDDAVTQDARLIELFDKYGMKILKKHPEAFASFVKVNEVFGNFNRKV